MPLPARKRKTDKATGSVFSDLAVVTGWMVGILLWAAVVVPYGRHGYQRLMREGSNDFTIFYYSGQRAASGRPLYGPLSPAELQRWPYTSLGNINLPHSHLILMPLSAMPYAAAAAAWASLSLLSLLGSLVLVGRELGVPRRGRTWVVGGATLAASAAYLSAIVAGEISFLLMTPFTLGWIAMRRQRWRTGGVWVGLCAAVKPFLGLYLAWFVLKRWWPSLLAGLASLAVCTILGVAVFGLGAYADWVRAVSEVDWWWPPENASIRGLTERLLVGGHGITPLVTTPAMAAWVYGLASAVVLLHTLRSARAGGDDANEIDRCVAVVFCGSLLVSPLGWVYYLPMATGAFLAVWSSPTEETRGGTALLAAGAAAFLLPLAYTEAGQPSALATLALASAYSWALLACWAGLLLSRR
jgi:hypothetical protein